MVSHDVSEETPSTAVLAAFAGAHSASALFLGAFGGGAARLHVDLCRLASAICTSRAAH
ncbi:putative leader peptide [Streptomyces sp. NPDC002825]|uniref:putative leader peptide n=1 Tax=Streptomyces sp. NPDC002825 TaxID=3154666 RepID=UPI00332E1B24